MVRSIRLALLGSIVAVLVVSGTALGTAGGRKVVDSSMTGIAASQAGHELFGVVGGGLPWAIDRGSARLFADGRLQVSVQGLVLAAGANAGRNPVATGRAIVSCGGQVAAMSSIVPFSPDGDAQVNEAIDLPSTCSGPVIFFAGITANGPRWFAITGW